MMNMMLEKRAESLHQGINYQMDSVQVGKAVFSKKVYFASLGFE